MRSGPQVSKSCRAGDGSQWQPKYLSSTSNVSASGRSLAWIPRAIVSTTACAAMLTWHKTLRIRGFTGSSRTAVWQWVQETASDSLIAEPRLLSCYVDLEMKIQWGSTDVQLGGRDGTLLIAYNLFLFKLQFWPQNYFLLASSLAFWTFFVKGHDYEVKSLAKAFRVAYVGCQLRGHLGCFSSYNGGFSEELCRSTLHVIISHYAFSRPILYEIIMIYTDNIRRAPCFTCFFMPDTAKCFL